MSRDLCFLAFAVLLTQAASTSPAATQRADSVRRFDVSIEQLPRDYQGDSIEQLFSRFLAPPKSEFETTEQYQARLIKPTGGEVYAFPLQNVAVGPNIAYNADKGELVIEILEDWGIVASYTPNRNVRAVSVKKTTLTSTYPGGNAFGATVQVRKSDESVYGLVIPGPAPGPGTERFHRFTLSVPADDARELKSKNRIGILFICEPDVRTDIPLTITGFDYTKPTLNSPYETTVNYHYLRVNLLALWLYDTATGRIFQKLDKF